MIEIARKNAPDVEFVVQDARNIALPGRFSAVFSTFDSLNHVMSLDELEQVFRGVFAVLASGGYFVFDLNMEEGFRSINPAASGAPIPLVFRLRATNC